MKFETPDDWIYKIKTKCDLFCLKQFPSNLLLPYRPVYICIFQQNFYTYIRIIKKCEYVNNVLISFRKIHSTLCTNDIA